MSDHLSGQRFNAYSVLHMIWVLSKRKRQTLLLGSRRSNLTILAATLPAWCSSSVKPSRVTLRFWGLGSGACKAAPN